MDLDPDRHHHNHFSRSIFSYENYLLFLKSQLEPSADHPHRLSVRQVASQLGYRSSRSLGMVLTGERLPSEKMRARFAQYLGLNSEESRYLDLLIRQERLRRCGHQDHLLEREIFRARRSCAKTSMLEPLFFSSISDWFYVVLKQLLTLVDFKLDLKWIRLKMGRKVTEGQILSALENLKTLGLIEIHKKTHKVRVLKPSLSTPCDVPSSAVREHHLQMSQQAQVALQNQPVHHREFISYTFTAHPDDLSRMKEFLREMKGKFANEFQDSCPTEVFQLNLQLFCHTQIKEEGDPCSFSL